MPQIVEAQRAIVEGDFSRKPGGVYEVRARLAIPNNATILIGERARLVLRGFWSESGYQSFGLAPLPMGEENTSTLEMQPDPEDDANLIYQVRPRTIILQDRRIFRRSSPIGWGPGDPDNKPEAQYEEAHLVRGRPFDFEAMWNRIGRQ